MMLFYPECIICNQIKFSKSVFCKFCLKKLECVKLKKRKVFGINHYSLFTWTEENDSFIRPLIYFLKGKSPYFFKDLSTLFKPLNLVENQTLISPPSSTKRQYSQAESLSIEISKLFGGLSVYSIEASKGFNTPKKRLKKKQRFRSLKISGKVREFKNGWVFVDDVLVSGSTLKSLIEIYGLPQAALTLVYRPVFGEEENYEELTDF